MASLCLWLKNAVPGGGWPAYVYGRGMLYQGWVSSLCLWLKNAVPGDEWPAYVYGRGMLYQRVDGQPVYGRGML